MKCYFFPYSGNDIDEEKIKLNIEELIENQDVDTLLFRKLCLYDSLIPQLTRTIKRKGENTIFLQSCKEIYEEAEEEIIKEDDVDYSFDVIANSILKQEIIKYRDIFIHCLLINTCEVVVFYDIPYLDGKVHPAYTYALKKEDCKVFIMKNN